MLKKRGIAWKTFIEFVVGAIVLSLIIGMVFPTIFPYPMKIWNETKILIGADVKDFEVYKEELKEDEVNAINSVNSLVCAINTVALGELDPYKTDGGDNQVCPLERRKIVKEEDKNKITSKVVSVTGNVIAKITGKATEQKSEVCTGKIKYGDTCIECKGSGSEKIVLGKDHTKKGYAKGYYAKIQIADAVYNCFKKFKKNKDLFIKGEEYYNCYILDARDIENIEITGEDVGKLLNEHPWYKDYGKDITGGSAWDLGLWNSDQLSFKTIKKRNNPYCVYLNKDLKSHDIVVGDCRGDVVDSMYCNIENFDLPQDTGSLGAFIPKSIIGAYGRPRWIMYYESFPQEKSAYWKKSFWGKILSLNTAINIVSGAVLNWGFAKVGALKAGKKIAEKAAVAGAKEAQEKAIKEIMEEGGEILVKRFSKNGISNTMRSLFIEEALQKIPGLTDDAAREITERILSVAKKKGGKKTFEDYLKKKLVSELDEVIEKGIKEGTIEVPEQFMEKGVMVTPHFKDAARFKAATVSEIMNRMPMETGDEVVQGVEGIFGKRMTQSAIKNIVAKESYEAFFRKFITKTGSVNMKTITDTAENTLKYLANVEKVGGTSSVNKLVQKSAAQLDDLIKGAPGETVRKMTAMIEKNSGKIPKELLKGTLGISWEETAEAMAKGKFKGAVHILKELQPLRLARSKWFKLLPGGRVTATIGKTTMNFVLDHRYPILVLLVLANELDREENRPSIPIGSNTLGITVPYLFGTDAKTYDLHEAASKYFITNKDKQEERLYLVSPCISDFQIVRKKCTCVSNPLRWRWNFGGGLMDIEPKEWIKPKPKSDIRKYAEEEVKNVDENHVYSAWKNSVPIYFKLVEEGFEKILSTDDLIDILKSKANDKGEKLIDKFNEMKGSTKVDIGHVLDVSKFHRANPLISKDEIAMEMWIEHRMEQATNFLDAQTQSYSNMVGVKVGWFSSERTDIDTDSKEAERFEEYSKYIDTSKAVKVCDSRGVFESAFSYLKSNIAYNPKTSIYERPTYKIECIEVIPNVKEGYCYDHFKTQEQMKIGVIVASAVTDIVISVATAGAAAPVTFLLTGAAAGFIESIISSTEVWPLRSEGLGSMASSILTGGSYYTEPDTYDEFVGSTSP